MRVNILVTGGAGYIGSFMVKRLLDDGNYVVVADSLERGHKEKIDPRAKFEEGNLADEEFVSSLFEKNDFDCVMHFAAYISVGESVENPGGYFKNNVFSTINILESMRKKGVKYFIFSSTGTVYGIPLELPIPENHPKNPENPYAQSKLMVEEILHWYHKAFGIGYAVLRYFNASGAALDGSLGESHNPETHLIPNAIKSAINKTKFELYGDDYDTKDGTAVRDYIHVLDLVNAHILTLEKLKDQKGEYVYNVGTGKGHSNKEVLDMVRKISGETIEFEIKPRRPGDVSETVADKKKIETELGFETQFSDLETIIKTAWNWHSSSKA